MFCPLCKAEYRQGFTQCSDCHISLVSTTQEAAAVPVQLLWKGGDRQKLDRIIDGLLDAGVPFNSQEKVKSQPWPWISLIFYRFAKPSPTFELEVSILARDLDRGRRVLESTEEPDLDSDA